MLLYHAEKSSSMHWSSSPRPTGTSLLPPAEIIKGNLRKTTVCMQLSRFKHGSTPLTLLSKKVIHHFSNLFPNRRNNEEYFIRTIIRKKKMYYIMHLHKKYLNGVSFRPCWNAHIVCYQGQIFHIEDSLAILLSLYPVRSILSDTSKFINCLY